MIKQQAKIQPPKAQLTSLCKTCVHYMKTLSYCDQFEQTTTVQTGYYLVLQCTGHQSEHTINQAHIR